MKTLETERLILRPFTEEDAPAVFEYAKDPDVGPAAGWKPHENEEESLHIIQTVFQDENALTWAICQKCDGKAIGSVALHADPVRRISAGKSRELGYALSRKFWGKGIMTEACQEVLRFAFAELELEILSAGHFPFNFRSRHVIEALGFRYDGTIRMAFEDYKGTVYHVEYYSMTSKEFQELSSEEDKA